MRISRTAPRGASSLARFVSAASACACVVVASISCSGGSKEPTADRQGDLKRREPARVRVAPVVAREMVRTLQTTTVVHSEGEIQLFPRASGVVTEVLVEEGDAVRVGQVLATLDDREAKASMAEAQVAIAEAKDAIAHAEVAQREAVARIHQSKLAWDQAVRDYERNEKAGQLSHQALDGLRTARDTRESDHLSAQLASERAGVDGRSAQTALKRAELALARAELELSYARIQAPTDGIIARCSVRVGGTVGRGTSVIETAGAAFVLTNLDDLHVQFHRPQRELAWFLDASARPASDSAGANAAAAGAENGRLPARAIDIRATAEALPGLVFLGAIERISPSIDAQSGSFTVQARLEPADVAARGAPSREAASRDESSPNGGAARAGARLLPGMLVRLEIVTDRHPGALTVPKRALRREGEQNLVFVVRDGRARRVEVREGFADDDTVEVLPVVDGALSAGESVVVVGNRDLEDGSDVALEAEAPPADAAPAQDG